MAWFGPPVEESAEVRIFGRYVEDGVQGLVVSARLRTTAPAGLCLPVPVAPDASPSDGTLRTARATTSLLERLDAAFTEIQGLPGEPPAEPVPRRNVVAEDVIWAPDREALLDLEPGLRPPEGSVAGATTHADAGFWVIRVPEGGGHLRPVLVTFPTREPDHIVFPVHEIPGREPPPDTVSTRHRLYFQLEPGRIMVFDSEGPFWQKAPEPPGEVLAEAAPGGCLLPDRTVYRGILSHEMKNVDVRVHLGDEETAHEPPEHPEVPGLEDQLDQLGQ